MNNLSLRAWGLDSRKYDGQERLLGFCIGMAYVLLGFCLFALIDTVRLVRYLHGLYMLESNPHNALAVLYGVLAFSGFIGVFYHRQKKRFGNLYLVAVCMGVFFGAFLPSLLEFLVQMFFANRFVAQSSFTFGAYLKGYWASTIVEHVVAALCLLASIGIRWRLRTYKLNVQRNSLDTSGRLGSAHLASPQDLTDYQFRGKEGFLLGKDAVGLLRLPHLTDHLILGYRGAGKTSTKLIPFILDYLYLPKLLTDIKGELAAVTAQKAITAGRIVYLLDPFQVLLQLGLSHPVHCFNPLSYIPVHDLLLRDRMILQH